MLMIYLSAVITAVILRHQERVHQAELPSLYQQLGRSIPLRKPKLPMLESWLNVVLGLFLAFGYGTLFLWSNFSRLRDFPNDPRFAPQSFEWEFTSIILATGIALLILGIQSVIQNRRYSRIVRPEEK